MITEQLLSLAKVLYVKETVKMLKCLITHSNLLRL